MFIKLHNICLFDKIVHQFDCSTVINVNTVNMK